MEQYPIRRGLNKSTQSSSESFPTYIGVSHLASRPLLHFVTSGDRAPPKLKPFNFQICRKSRVHVGQTYLTPAWLPGNGGESYTADPLHFKTAMQVNHDGGFVSVQARIFLDAGFNPRPCGTFRTEHAGTELPLRSRRITMHFQFLPFESNQIPSPRFRPKRQSTVPREDMTPEIWRPSCCSSAGRQGTSRKPSPSSIIAKRPDESVTR